MALTTKPFLAQDALKTILGTALPTWKTEFGQPPAAPAVPTVIIEENIPDDWELSSPLSGSTAQDESFNVFVYLYFQKTNGTPETMRADMDVAYSAAKAAIQADPTLSGSVSFAHIASNEYASGITDAGTRAAQMTLRVACTAYIG